MKERGSNPQRRLRGALAPFASTQSPQLSRRSEEDDDELRDDEDSEVNADEFVRMLWVPWFCSLYGHEIFVEADEEFIRDGFNLYGLKAKFPKYDAALAMILGEAPTQADFTMPDIPEIYQQATELYASIHARYILTPKGLLAMRQKYLNGVFGRCPRVLCDGQNVLPVGLTDELRQHRVRAYCPQCQETYLPRLCASTDNGTQRRSSDHQWESDEEEVNDEDATMVTDIDGAFFGPSFPHCFLLQFTQLIPKGPPKYFEPKIFGFKVHSAKSVIQIKLERGEYGKQYKRLASDAQPT